MQFLIPRPTHHVRLSHTRPPNHNHSSNLSEDPELQTAKIASDTSLAVMQQSTAQNDGIHAQGVNNVANAYLDLASQPSNANYIETAGNSVHAQGSNSAASANLGSPKQSSNSGYLVIGGIP